MSLLSEESIIHEVIYSEDPDPVSEVTRTLLLNAGLSNFFLAPSSKCAFKVPVYGTGSLLNCVNEKMR